ncbi:HAD-IC family P-type ATPase, partial [bacterium]|nr:HAD-IC family P-type ATPase [bacterium]
MSEMNNKYYIEGVSCPKCLAKIHKIGAESDGITSLNVNMSTQTLEVNSNSLFNEGFLTQQLADKGYTIKPLLDDDSALENIKKENRDFLFRMGVAGACAGNIMILSVSIYSGAKVDIGKSFEWLSFAMFLPVLFYSAWPFYKNAISSFKAKSLSVDLPIAFALIFGGALSFYNIFTQYEKTYFDSLSVLVFLLLASRYLLRKIQQKYLNISYLNSYFPKEVRVLDGEKEIYKPVGALKIDEVVLVKKGEVIPVDGINQFGSALINNAIITGESWPINSAKGNECFAGATLLSEKLLVKTSKSFKQSRVSQLLDQLTVELRSPTAIATLGDKFANYFVLVLTVVGLVFFAYYSQVNFEEAINRFLALIILACPCAVALATPLVQSLSLIKAGERGIFIKKANIFDKFDKIKNVVFDKTGTLTRGEFEVIKWKEKVSDELKDIILSLEEGSLHPVAHAFRRSFEGHSFNPVKIKDLKETPGVGVSGLVGDDLYDIKSGLDKNHATYTSVGIYKNGEMINQVHLGDEVNEDALRTVGQLKSLGKRVFLMSGDNQGASKKIGSSLNILEDQILSDFSPEDKFSWIKQHPESLMVGDGMNDSLALSKSLISIAANGSLESSLKASDVYLSKPGLFQIVDLMKLSTETLVVIKRALTFSFIYNVVGSAL